MAFPFLSLTGRLGLLLFPESVLVISYSLFMLRWPAAVSASAVSSSMKFLLSLRAQCFTSLFVSQYRACSSRFSARSCVWLIVSFKFFLSVMSVQVSVVSHSLCFLVFLPRTVLHVVFQVSRRLLHCSSIVSSCRCASTLNLFCSSVLNSSAFAFSFKVWMLNLCAGLPAWSL